jgi:hypothetical protein
MFGTRKRHEQYSVLSVASRERNTEKLCSALTFTLVEVWWTRIRLSAYKRRRHMNSLITIGGEIRLNFRTVRWSI